MNKNYLLIILLLSITIHGNAQLKEISNSGLANLRNSIIASSDFNNDGFKDIIMSGINSLNNFQCKVYTNNRNNTFSDLGANIIALVDGDISLSDFNADGFLDIAISGQDASNKRHTKVYVNNQGAGFTEIATAFHELCYGSVAWVDYDNDADLDLFICGQDDDNVRKTIIYENNGDGSFTGTAPNLPNISRGKASWGDVNKDGWPDVAISGMDNSNNYITEIYLNNGNKSFTPYNANLQKLAFTEQELIDYDNDGDLDFWISGTDKDGYNHTTLYRNDNGNYVAASFAFVKLWNVSASWSDFDADGDADLVYMGLDDINPLVCYYRNDKTTFTKTNLGINNAAEGELLWLDTDNDNKQDLMVAGSDQAGQSTMLYQNTLAISNTVPTPPENLNAIVEENSVILSWQAASDNESGSNGLSYRLCLGTEPGNYNLLPDMLTVGHENKLSEQGLLIGITANISGLSEGKYYWSVIAIDASNENSPPALSGSFAICDAVSLGEDKEVCTGGMLELSIGTANDEVDWYSEKEGLLVSNNLLLSHAVSQNDKIIGIVNKSIGCSVNDTILVRALALPPVPLEETARACIGKSVSFDIGDEDETVNWYAQNGALIQSGNQLERIVLKDETIKCVLTDINNCTDSAKVAIRALSLPNASLGDDFGVCLSDTAYLEIAGMQTVDWYGLSGSLLFNNLENIGLQIMTDTTVVANFTNHDNCSNSDTITIKVNSIKGVDAGKDTLICFDTEAMLSVRVDGGAAPYIYAWSNSVGAEIASDKAISISPTINDTYTVSVIDNNGCKASDDVKVEINKKPIINAGPNKAVCIGESTIIGGAPSAQNSLFDFAYRWEPQTGLDDPYSENPEAFPTETTFYKMIVSTYYCEEDTAEVTVFVNPLPYVTISNDTTIGVGETIRIVAGGGDYYDWSPVDGLSSPDYYSTFASPIEETAYEVTVEDENGCIDKASVTINVLTDLFIPNLFTPNGDGMNDSFKIYGTGIAQLKMIIYDRNGNIVFNSNNIQTMQETGWDGKTNGVDQVQGTYMYVISGQYVDGSAIEYKGNKGVVNLMR